MIYRKEERVSFARLKVLEKNRNGCKWISGSAIAEEVFHGDQFENNGAAVGIKNEVEAQLVGLAMSGNRVFGRKGLRILE